MSSGDVNGGHEPQTEAEIEMSTHGLEPAGKRWQYKLWWPWRICTWFAGGAPDVKVLAGLCARKDQPVILCIVDAKDLNKGLGMSFMTVENARSIAWMLTRSADQAEAFRGDKDASN